jgi:hypothetical protein
MRRNRVLWRKILVADSFDFRSNWAEKKRMNLAEDYFSKKYFSEEFLPETSKKLKLDAKILFFKRVFRRHHGLQDPINNVDPNGTSIVGIIFGGACFAYDLYDSYSTSKDVQKYKDQINNIQKQIDSLDAEKDCDKISDLKQQGIKAAQALAKAQNGGAVKSLGVAALCAGLTKL